MHADTVVWKQRTAEALMALKRERTSIESS